MWYYILAAVLFVLSQLAWFLLSRVICQVTLGFQFIVDTRFLICYFFLCRALIQK
jgi:hypothetical protein